MPDGANLAKANREVAIFLDNIFTAQKRVRLRVVSFKETQGLHAAAGLFYQMSRVGKGKFPSRATAGGVSRYFPRNYGVAEYAYA